MKSICIYCGSSTGADPAYSEAARAFGSLVAKSGRTLVYGGGSIGLMGVAARAAKEAGGHVIGVIPQHLNTRERAYDEIDLRVVKTMHERKWMMAELSDAFVALPGGLGTFDELFEILTWNQIGLHEKPVGLLNVSGYFDRLLDVIDHAVKEGFARGEARTRIVTEVDPARLIAAMEARTRADGRL